MDIDIEKGNAAIIQRDATSLVDIISRDVLEGSNDTKATLWLLPKPWWPVCGHWSRWHRSVALQNDVAKACLRELERVSMPDLVLNTPRAASHAKAIEGHCRLC